MKRFLLILFSLLLISANATSLKGGVTEEYIPNGFFGSWGVISKLRSSNNPVIFNTESRDIWTLSGHGDVLVLENLESGARSEIIVREKNKDGKTLKFQREKVVNKNGRKIIYKETVQFVLLDDNFVGTDDFVVENYDLENNLIKKNTANYSVSGVRISGTKP